MVSATTVVTPDASRRVASLSAIVSAHTIDCISSSPVASEEDQALVGAAVGALLVSAAADTLDVDATDLFETVLDTFNSGGFAVPDEEQAFVVSAILDLVGDACDWNCPECEAA